MTAESNYTIAIATLSDWLKNLALDFQPTRSKNKTNRNCTRDFSLALSKLQVTARNSDWFIALSAMNLLGLLGVITLVLAFGQ